jgi:hypothetical protein
LRTQRIQVITVNPHNDDLQDALRTLGKTDGDDLLLLLLALRPKSGAGAITVPDAIRDLAKRRANKTIAVAFGSPYILRELGDISTFVCAWGPQPSLQIAAMRAIRGEIEMHGRLPVSIE